MSDFSPEEASLFNRCRHLADFYERELVLEQACGDNLALRARVKELLHAYDQEPEFLNHGSFLTAPTAPPSVVDLTGERVGPYELLKGIGQGGMGIVYLARQVAPIRRMVAIKIIRPGLDSDNLILRFEAERQALAVMDHPHVAKVFDAGVTDDGRPYFVMEYIDGVSITKFCDRMRLNVPERLRLFLSVCDAVQHAHRKGVIHRDIKPSNILVAVVDGRPVPKVIDFGVAKAINQKLTGQTICTSIGQFVGTLEYMSPEQVRHDQAAIDTRTDVYGLGVLLYELLAGVTPFEARRLRSVNFDELIRILCHEEPPPPTRRVASTTEATRIAESRGVQSTEIRKELPRELDWIVLKAIEKDPAKRYSSPQELADDIQRFLDGRTILARSPRTSVRVWKWARRHSMASVLGLTAVLTGAAITAGLAYHNAMLKETLAEAHKTNYAADMNNAWGAYLEDDLTAFHRIISRYDDGQPLAPYHGPEWEFLAQLIRRDGTVLSQVNHASYGAVFSPDESSLAIYGASPVLRIINPRTGAVLQEWDTGQKELNGVTYALDGKRLWTTGDDGTVREWNIADKRQLNIITAYDGEIAYKVLCDEKNNQLITCGRVPAIRFWDADSGKLLAERTDHGRTVQTLIWLRDGRHFLSASDDSTAMLWDATDRCVVQKYETHKDRLLDVAISPDQSTVAVCSSDGFVQLFDRVSGKPLVQAEFKDSPNSLIFGPEGKRLAVMDRKGNVHIFEFFHGNKKEKPTLTRQSALATNSNRSFSLTSKSDGTMLMTCSAEGRVTAWSAPWTAPTVVRDLACPGVCDIQFVQNSQSIVAVGEGIRVLAVSSGEITRTQNLERHYDYVSISTGRDMYAAADANRVVTIGSLDGGRQPREFDSAVSSLSNSSVSLSADGTTLGIAESRGEKLLIVDESTLKPRKDLAPKMSRLVAFSPAAPKLFAYTSIGGGLHIHDDMRSEPHVWTKTTSHVDHEALAFSSDGKWLASSSSDRVIRIWNVVDGNVIHELRRNPKSIDNLAFSPNGRTLASIDSDGSLKLWHIASGRLMLDVKAEPRSGCAEVCRFSPDGKWLAHTHGPNSIRLIRMHRPSP